VWLLGGREKCRIWNFSRVFATLRARAEQILAQAETMTDADARDMMHAVAVSYEKLAWRLEQEADEA
jgi:DNA-binding ferritin-like protein